MVISEKYLVRFWERINKSGPIPKHVPEIGNCWQWLAGTSGGKYGKLRIGDKHYSTHRLSFMIHNPLQNIDEKLICHKCDNVRCVNPEHLFVGDSIANVRDCISKNRRAKLSPPVMHGESNPSAKLSDKQVLEILASNGRQVDIAEMYGVCQSTISRIKLGKRAVNVLPVTNA